MNIPLFVLNAVFYGIVFYLYGQAKQDPSISLGVGFAYMFLFVAFPVLQFVLWRTRVIRAETNTDKVLMLTCTPILPLIGFAVLAALDRTEARSSTTEYNVNYHRYQEVHYSYSRTGAHRKTAFFKSVDTVSEVSPFPATDEWVKDSTWLYFSENGDTTQKEYYRNDTLIRSTAANSSLLQ